MTTKKVEINRVELAKKVANGDVLTTAEVMELQKIAQESKKEARKEEKQQEEEKLQEQFKEEFAGFVLSKKEEFAGMEIESGEMLKSYLQTVIKSIPKPPKAKGATSGAGVKNAGSGKAGTKVRWTLDLVKEAGETGIKRDDVVKRFVEKYAGKDEKKKVSAKNLCLTHLRVLKGVETKDGVCRFVG